ncbi:MAG TPA: LEA type 2 family protein [Puia sp.]|nr:LEA type 2 family protein [Puia sp.]
MKPISLILFFSGLFFLVSCSKPEAPEYLGFRDFSLDNISMDSALLHTQLAFYNPNTFVMELKRGEVNVFLDNKLANHYIMDSTINIPKKDTFFVPLNLRISPKLLISSALSMLMNNNKIKVRMEGSIRVKRGAITFTVPINYEVLETIK